MTEMNEQTVGFPTGSKMIVREPDTSLSDNVTLIQELQEAFPELRPTNVYALKRQLVKDSDYRNSIIERYFDFALTPQERRELEENPEIRLEVFSRFKQNVERELFDSSYTGQALRDTLIDRTVQLGVDLETFPVEEYKGLLDDNKYAGVSPDTLKQELQNNPSLYRQLLEDRYDQFEQSLQKQHNPTAVLKDDPTKLAQAWVVFDRFGSEGLTQFVNLEQFRGQQVDDISGAFQQLRDAQEFFGKATSAGKTVGEHLRTFFSGSEVKGVPFQNEINQAAYKYGISPALLAAMIKKESEFDPEAIGKAGEIGLGQIMEITAGDLGLSQEDLRDPEKNIDGSARYLAQQLREFNYDTTKALAAYNWGPGRVREAVSKYGDNWHMFMPDSTKSHIQAIYEFQQEFEGVAEPMIYEPLRERDDVAVEIPPDLNRYMSEWYSSDGKGFYRKDEFSVAKSFIERYFPEPYQSPEEIEKLRRYGSSSENFSKIAYSIYENAINSNEYDLDDLLRSVMAAGEYQKREDGRDQWIVNRDALDVPRQLAFEALTFSSEYNYMFSNEGGGNFSIVPDRREASIENWRTWKNNLFATQTVVENGEFVEKPATGILPTAWNTAALVFTTGLDFVNRYVLEPGARIAIGAAELVGADTDNARAVLDDWYEKTLGASLSDVTSWEEDGYFIGTLAGIAPFVQYMAAMIYGGRGLLKVGAKGYQYLTRGKTLNDVLQAGAILKNTKYARASANLSAGIKNKAPWVSGLGVYYTGGALVEATQPQEVSFYKLVPEMIGMSPTNDLTKLYDQASTAGKVGMDVLGSLVLDTFFDHAIGAARFGISKAAKLRGRKTYKSVTWNPQKNGGQYEIVDAPQFKTDIREFWHNLLGPIRELPDGVDYGITRNIADREAATMKGLARGFADDANFVMGDIKQEIRSYLDHVNKEFGDGIMLSDAQIRQVVDEQYSAFLDRLSDQMSAHLRAADDTGDTTLRFANALEDLQPTVREIKNIDFSPVTPSEVSAMRAEGRQVVRFGDKVYEIDQRYWTTDLAERMRQRTFKMNADETLKRRLREENLSGKQQYSEAEIARITEIEDEVRRAIGIPVKVEGRMGYVVDMQGGDYIIRTEEGNFVRQSQISSEVDTRRLEILAGAAGFQRVQAEMMAGGAGFRQPPRALLPEARPASVDERYLAGLELRSQVAAGDRPILTTEIPQPQRLLPEPEFDPGEVARLDRLREIDDEIAALRVRHRNAELAIANKPLTEYSPAERKQINKDIAQYRREITQQIKDLEATRKEVQRDLSVFLLENPQVQGLRRVTKDIIDANGDMAAQSKVFAKNLEKANAAGKMIHELQQKPTKLPFCN